MRTILFLSLLLALALALPALAQGPSQDGYSTDGPQAIERTGGGDPEQVEGGSSSLPFTGFDLVLVAALGTGLLGIGAGMRRLTRPGPADPASG